jgi:lambda family phage portal protein
MRSAKRQGVLLYDARGNVLRASTATGFEPASRRARLTTWTASSQHVNALLPGELGELRRKARDADRKNPYAIAARETTVANLVGNGIVPVVVCDDAELKKEVRAAWDEWIEECDTEGMLDFYGLQALMVSGVYTAGDAFLRFRPRDPSDGLSVPLQLQLLDGEMCAEAKNEAPPGSGRVVKAGVEFDGLGRRRAYWFYREHPGELTWLFSGSWNDPVPVPAAQVMHCFHQITPGQVRGIPWAAGVLVRLHDLDEYQDAEMVRKKIAAMMTAFVTTPGDDDPIGGGSAGTDDEDDMPLAYLEPGTVQYLGPGEGVEIASPADVGGAYESFVRVARQELSSGLGLAYHQLTGDLSQVNFSTIRSVLIEQRRRFGAIQRNMIAFKVCRPVWRRWLETALLSGRLKIPRAGREEILFKLMRPKWVATPGFEWVQPERQVESDVAELKAGLTSRTRLVAERGYDVEDLDEEIAADREREERLGLVLEGSVPEQPAPGTPGGPPVDDEGLERPAAAGGLG